MPERGDHTVPGASDRRFSHDFEVEHDGVQRKVTLSVLSYAHIYVKTGKGEFRSCKLPLVPAVIPATGETVFRMDLDDVKATLQQLDDDGVFREEEEYLGRGQQ